MGRKKRSEDGDTNKLLSCWVNPLEFALIKKAIEVKSPNESMSEFLRKIIMPSVKKILIENKFSGKLVEIDKSNLPEPLK